MRVAFIVVSATIYLFVIAITATNWYEYRAVSDAQQARVMVSEGWQVVHPELNFTYLRRPRFHLP